MGVFAPYAFFFLSLLGPILWFYLWREKKHVLPVSSIIPWRNLPTGQTPENKAFRVDWQLILQILAIVLATLALTRLYWLKTVPFNRQVIIIDNSASMSAREEEGKSRLELAKEKALALLDRLDAQTQVAIVQMAGSARVAQEFTKDRRLLKEALEGIEPTQEGTNFPAGLNLARSFLQGYAGGKIHLISDGGQWLADNPEALRQVQPLQVGKSLENVAITALDSYQGLYADLRQTVYIRLANYSPRSRQVWLRALLDGRPLQRRRLKLLPDSYQNIPLKLPERQGLLKVIVEAEDALPQDNAAYLLLQRQEPLSVLLVTPSDVMEDDFARLAAATGRINYSRILPEQFDPALLGGYRLLIFHEAAPTSHLPIDTLYIASPPGHGLWKVSGELISHPRILDWDRRHPALKHLDFLERLDVGSSSRVRLPEWGNLLIGTPRQPLAFWGEQGGFKQLVFCFDLQPLLFPPSQDVSGIILFLNSLDWLTSSIYKNQRIKTGEPYVLSTSKPLAEVLVTDPRGKQTSFQPEGNKFYFDATHYAGLYRVSARDVEGKQHEYAFVANLLDEAEAKLRVADFSAKAAATAEAAQLKSHKEPQELWRLLLLCVVLTLLGEWWLYLRE